jgi:Second Messenger Oligonucleotide or Dinucleotide Synthetase domain
VFTLGTHFDVLLKNIQPPEDRLKAAIELPPKVRNYIENHADFGAVAPWTRLVGSYAQHTSVGDVKDVDFLIAINGDPDSNDPPAKAVVQNLCNALQDLPAALGEDGHAEAEIEIERARRSVHVYIGDRNFHLDVVPCIVPNSWDEPLWVPDRGFNKWIPSHPVGFVNLLTELTREHGEKVRQLGKLFKHFRNIQMQTRKPKSYWLGALLVDHVQNKLDMTQPLSILFRDLLDGVCNRYASLLPRTDEATPNIKDPLLGHNVSWNWSRTHFETFMHRLDEGRKWATKALEAEERDSAIDFWQRIFGEDYFPSDVSDEVKRLAAAAMPGSAYVSGTGLILSRRPASGVATPVRSTTFHGSEPH